MEEIKLNIDPAQELSIRKEGIRMFCIEQALAASANMGGVTGSELINKAKELEAYITSE